MELNEVHLRTVSVRGWPSASSAGTFVTPNELGACQPKAALGMHRERSAVVQRAWLGGRSAGASGTEACQLWGTQELSCRQGITDQPKMRPDWRDDSTQAEAQATPSAG